MEQLPPIFYSLIQRGEEGMEKFLMKPKFLTLWLLEWFVSKVDVTFSDVLDGLDHHVVLHVVSDDAGVAAVVEEGEGGVDSCSYEHWLGSLLTGLAHLPQKN